MTKAFPVSPRKRELLTQRMRALDVEEKELVERFVCASGKGGQHVNRVATCVVLRHAPSGREIKCQESRSQGLNRYYARVRLCDVLERERLGAQSAEEQRRQKIRRQKRKRSKRAKDKILEDKRHRAQVKAGRKPVLE